MANAKKILGQAKKLPESISLADLRKLVRAAGFTHKRTSGDHEIYGRDGIPEIVNIQPRKGDRKMAKIYQVEQVVDVIDRYHIEVE